MEHLKPQARWCETNSEPRHSLTGVQKIKYKKHLESLILDLVAELSDMYFLNDDEWQRDYGHLLVNSDTSPQCNMINTFMHVAPKKPILMLTHANIFQGEPYSADI